MFFVLSKILFFIAQPSSAMVLMIAAGLFAGLLRERWRKAGFRVATAGLVLLLVGGLSPLANALVMPLEQRFPQIEAGKLPAGVAGAIVLGGGEDMRGGGTAHALGVNEAGERFTEAARLAKAHPELRLVFTGGVGRLFGDRFDSVVDLVAGYWSDMGIARDRMAFEGKSRNTRENAEFTKPVLGDAAGRRWLLVTSAYHMPRAMGVFRRAGYDVIAYPVDYRTAAPDDLMRWFGSVPDGLERLDLAVKEWIGLMAYRSAGYTDALFPAP